MKFVGIVFPLKKCNCLLISHFEDQCGVLDLLVEAMKLMIDLELNGDML